MKTWAFLVIVAYASTVSVTIAQQPEMVPIPAGEFTMGSDKRASDERPAHRVDLPAYAIGKYEVTNAEYYRFWQEVPSHTPESFPDDYGIGTWPERALEHPNLPVVGVSWHNAAAYAEWIGMRLPTEAEWEKAARGPSDRLWPWGSNPQPYANIWDGKDGYDNGLAPVGHYPKGKSYYGVMDMAGNVWEWTADRYDDAYYYHTPKHDPRGPETGSWRVIRGGSWVDNLNRCATTFRFYFYPRMQTSFIGFRLARDLPEESETP